MEWQSTRQRWRHDGFSCSSERQRGLAAARDSRAQAPRWPNGFNESRRKSRQQFRRQQQRRQRSRQHESWRQSGREAEGGRQLSMGGGALDGAAVRHLGGRTAREHRGGRARICIGATTATTPRCGLVEVTYTAATLRACAWRRLIGAQLCGCISVEQFLRGAVSLADSHVVCPLPRAGCQSCGAAKQRPLPFTSHTKFERPPRGPDSSRDPASSDRCSLRTDTHPGESRRGARCFGAPASMECTASRPTTLRRCRAKRGWPGPCERLHVGSLLLDVVRHCVEPAAASVVLMVLRAAGTRVC